MYMQRGDGRFFVFVFVFFLTIIIATTPCRKSVVGDRETAIAIPFVIARAAAYFS